MKSITLLLIIILAAAVYSQAQTVQKKSHFLNSRVIKGQYNLGLQNNSFADSLTLAEKLMIRPLGSDLYFRINAPYKKARADYLNATQIHHKLFYNTINVIVKNWYTNKYDLGYFGLKWPVTNIQRPLNDRLPANPGSRTLFPLPQKH